MKGELDNWTSAVQQNFNIGHNVFFISFMFRHNLLSKLGVYVIWSWPCDSFMFKNILDFFPTGL